MKIIRYQDGHGALGFAAQQQDGTALKLSEIFIRRASPRANRRRSRACSRRSLPRPLFVSGSITAGMPRKQARNFPSFQSCFSRHQHPAASWRANSPPDSSPQRLKWITSASCGRDWPRLQERQPRRGFKLRPGLHLLQRRERPRLATQAWGRTVVTWQNFSTPLRRSARLW